MEILPRENWSYQVGSGIATTIEVINLTVGIERFLCFLGIPVEIIPPNGAVYVAAGDKLLGYIEYNDPLKRPGLSFNRG
ncbi:MAG: hypothetical protein RML10_13725 [Geminocystis sp.]|nr:hypothetical protein [Geminocystis sp.]MDW8464600.1 hypothetical protein [Geminocystis sp.]